jgi:hypothetical protein
MRRAALAFCVAAVPPIALARASYVAAPAWRLRFEGER